MIGGLRRRFPACRPGSRSPSGVNLPAVGRRQPDPLLPIPGRSRLPDRRWPDTGQVNTAKAPGRLGEFLQARRSRLRPEDIGLATYGDRRRVPGLRREEVALLAGVSSSYYTRLEQGESHQMSDSVVESIANALRLDDSERLHLRRLAWPAQYARRET